MSILFPGMDPYLEDPRIWSGVHNRFIVYLADKLQPLIRPRYIAAVEERVFVQGTEQREIIPDAWLKRQRPEANPAEAAVAVLDVDMPVVMQVPELEIHESYVEILDRESEQRIVTVELLSPTNKFPGAGQESYLAKQREVRASQTHLIEIDLLRRVSTFWRCRNGRREGAGRTTI